MIAGDTLPKMQPATFIENHFSLHKVKKATPHRDSFFYYQVVKNQSSNKMSIIWQAALATEVPGPKMATMPAIASKAFRFPNLSGIPLP